LCTNFPPTASVLLQKEKDTKLEELINRLCALRGIELNKLKNLKILDDEGKKVDLGLTVGESGLPFIEIIDKSTEKEKKKKKQVQVKEKTRDMPSIVKISIGQNCYLPLEEQLFDDEKSALKATKQFEVAKYFSDEYIMSVLFAKKFDLKKTEEFLKNCFAWRKEKGFMKIPKFSEISKDSFYMANQLPGARDKLGRSIRYVRSAKMIPNTPGYTVEELNKVFVWLHYVGIFSDGIDSLRNGICMISDLEGYGWKNFDIDFQRQTSTLWLERLPLLMRKILVLHTPTIFAAIVKIMGTMMKNKLLDRFDHVQVKDLGKYIEQDNLISEYGGNVPYTPEDYLKSLEEWAERCEERLIAPGSDYVD